MAGSGRGSQPQGRGGSGGSRGGARRVQKPASGSQNGRQAGAQDDTQDPELALVSPPPTATRRRRFFNRRNVIIGVLVLVVVLVGAGALYAWFTVNKPLPTLNGTAQLPGLTANVTVTRDNTGVPHIVAANVHDLYMAQGYVHAQDRLYQMFFFRTAGEGRLSELFNASLVETDIYLRTVGFRRAAQTEWDRMGSDTRLALEAYADGVNAFVHSHHDSLPIEFTLLGVGFEDWQPIDSITFAKLQAQNLSESWSSELLTSDIIQKVGPGVAAQLIPGYPGGAPVIVPGANSGSFGPAIDGYNRYVKPLFDGWDAELGSNNWVVDGTKSATGKPILANDPHLGIRNPSIWYQIHLTTTDGKYDDVGFGFASAPGIVTGHNKEIAWGVTNTEADVEDVFLEKLDEQNHPGKYLSGTTWLPLTTLTETIQVKGQSPVTQTVRYTNHGPILSDANPLSPTVSTSITGTYSVEWTALMPGHVLESVYALQTASNWTDFRAALAKWDVPGQNFVYADTKGNIGYQMTGLLPIRKKGDGSVPGIGWTGENDWTGFVPYDDMPRMYNPPDHFIATANNKNVGSGFKYQVSGYWAPPYRIDRITALLKAKEKLSVEDMKSIQLDTTSDLARKVAPIIVSASATITDTTVKQAADLLKTWDGNMAADSVPAAIYEITYNHILTNTFSDDLGSDLTLQYLATMGGQSLQAIEKLVDKPDDPLWDNKGTTQVEKRDDIIKLSLTQAVGEIGAALGANLQDWTWGKIHEITPRHEFSSADLVGGLFTLASSPLGGDNTTIAIGAYPQWLAGYPLQGPLQMSSHQSYRMIIDTGDWTKSVAIFGTGESGQPGSKYWGNLYPLWVSGTYEPMLYTNDQISAAKDALLTLTP